MVAMGDTGETSSSFAIRHVAISVDCAVASTFALGRAGMAKGQIGMVGREGIG
jgi:hypothetical protein